MSWIHRLLRFLPGHVAADMERESRAWKLICPKCGHVTSYWEIGGVRWKAAGNPRNLLRCGGCGQRTWHRAEYRPPAATPPAT